MSLLLTIVLFGWVWNVSRSELLWLATVRRRPYISEPQNKVCKDQGGTADRNAQKGLWKTFSSHVVT